MQTTNRRQKPRPPHTKRAPFPGRAAPGRAPSDSSASTAGRKAGFPPVRESPCRYAVQPLPFRPIPSERDEPIGRFPELALRTRRFVLAPGLPGFPIDGPPPFCLHDVSQAPLTGLFAALQGFPTAPTLPQTRSNCKDNPPSKNAKYAIRNHYEYKQLWQQAPSSVSLRQLISVREVSKNTSQSAYWATLGCAGWLHAAI